MKAGNRYSHLALSNELATKILGSGWMSQKMTAGGGNGTGSFEHFKSAIIIAWSPLNRLTLQPETVSIAIRALGSTAANRGAHSPFRRIASARQSNTRTSNVL